MTVGGIPSKDKTVRISHSSRTSSYIWSERAADEITRQKRKGFTRIQKKEDGIQNAKSKT